MLDAEDELIEKFDYGQVGENSQESLLPVTILQQEERLVKVGQEKVHYLCPIVILLDYPCDLESTILW